MLSTGMRGHSATGYRRGSSKNLESIGRAFVIRYRALNSDLGKLETRGRIGALNIAFF
jgi:hypothetical protein